MAKLYKTKYFNLSQTGDAAAESCKTHKKFFSDYTPSKSTAVPTLYEICTEITHWGASSYGTVTSYIVN